MPGFLELSPLESQTSHLFGFGSLSWITRLLKHGHYNHRNHYISFHYKRLNACLMLNIKAMCFTISRSHKYGKSREQNSPAPAPTLLERVLTKRAFPFVSPESLGNGLTRHGARLLMYRGSSASSYPLTPTPTGVNVWRPFPNHPTSWLRETL